VKQVIKSLHDFIRLRQIYITSRPLPMSRPSKTGLRGKRDFKKRKFLYNQNRSKNCRLLRVNQLRIQFTNKPITAWGGLATMVAKLLEVLEFRSWVEDNLNLDSSVLIRYGNQQGAKRGYNPKKRGRPSHHPLLAFLGPGYVVNVWNRPGDIGTGQGAVNFFRQTLMVLGENFRITRVLCDSGFYEIALVFHNLIVRNGFC